MIHNKTIRYLHRSESASNYLQYTMGLSLPVPDWKVVNW